MAPLTIFGDIHANLPALEAVLADMDARGLHDRYCLGDLMGYCVWPNEVIAAVRDPGTPTIMGNYDLGVGNTSDDCGCAYKDPAAEALGHRSIAWSNVHTTDTGKAHLRSLVPAIPLQIGDLRVQLVHGSPRRVNEYLYADRPDSSLERLLDLAEADVLVCGHTHIPYHRVLPSGRPRNFRPSLPIWALWAPPAAVRLRRAFIPRPRGDGHLLGRQHTEAHWPFRRSLGRHADIRDTGGPDTRSSSPEPYGVAPP